MSVEVLGPAVGKRKANVDKDVAVNSTRVGFAIVLLLPGIALGQYTESFETWTASSAGSWQTQDLSGAPYNVPADAVVEVVVRNSDTTNQAWGGVRAFGSSLERRFLLHNAEAGGVEVVVMHVQTDASSRIEHYAGDTSDIDFVLLGYWDTGAYVESFDSFTAGASGSWENVNLNTYGVSADEVAEIVIENASTTDAREAGVRTDGSSLSRLVDIHTNEDFGDDLATMFVRADNVANATIEAYAESDGDITFYHMGYWSTPPGDYTELASNVGEPTDSATWEDKPLSSFGVPNFAVVEMVMGNASDFSENEIGVREDGSSINRLLDLQEAETGVFSSGDDLARMHVQSGTSAIIEWYFEDDLDSPSFLVAGYWKPVLSDHDAGLQPDAFTESSGETDAELIGFSLTPVSTFTITQIVFRISGITGLTDGDWAGLEIRVDDNDDGDIGGGETTTVGGSGTVNQAAGTITFSTSFSVSAPTNYILRADFASLSLGDTVTVQLDNDDITTTAEISGQTTATVHIEKTECYTQAFESWTASSADTWQTQSLSGAPYNVPANAVVEVAVRNDNTSDELWGGVRAVGSSLDRRFQLHKAESGGTDVVVVHVQTNASSQVQHYSDVTADVDFVLLGYWTCGTYVEAFDSFTAGADASWEDKGLCSNGVSPSGVAEIVMTNDNTGAEREAGVRTNGSVLERRLDLMEAEDGGVDAASMFVIADATLSATIELYAEADADVDFYLVGYWSKAPLAYTEAFADVGSPTADGTWEDLDLSGNGVPIVAVAEFTQTNSWIFGENEMGVRENSSSLSRVLDLRESEGGGGDHGRMHVMTDTYAKVEFYHEDTSDPHEFRLVGHWDTCDSSVSYAVSDLGAITSTNSSIGLDVNASTNVAGFEETGAGVGSGWFSDCGSFTALGNLGGSETKSFGINASDVVTGWSLNGSGNSRAFTWTSGGGLVDLGTAEGRTHSEGFAINGSDEVVGTLYEIDTNPTDRLAMIYLPVGAHTLTAGMHSLGTLGGEESVAMDINASGQVVGGAFNSLQFMRPFRWQNGTMSDLGTLGGDDGDILSRAQAINTSGDVVGAAYTAGGDRHAFMWDGSMTDLGVLGGGDDSLAFDINDSNVVVGTSNVTGGEYHAFIYDATNGLRDLNDLISGSSGWTLTRATGINNDGRIVGYGTNGSADVRAFLLTSSCGSSGGGPGALLLQSNDSRDTTVRDKLFALDAFGDPVGTVDLVYSDSDAPHKFRAITTPADDVNGPGIPPGTRAGIKDGAAIRRTFVFESAAPAGSFRAIVTAFVWPEALEGVGYVDDVRMLAMDASDAVDQRAWTPAGAYVGEADPTSNAGDTGFYETNGGQFAFWTNVDRSGVYTVGVPAPDDEPTNLRDDAPTAPPQPPCLCGLCGLPTMISLFFALVGTRKMRSRHRKPRRRAG